jgi:hypothetical protein
VLWLASFVPLILLLLVPLSSPLWHYTPQLAFVQFPWRWLLVLAPIAALFATAGIARHTRTPWLIALASVLCIASIIAATRRFHQYCDEEDNVAAKVALMHDGSGQEGTDEYTPRNDDNAEIYQDMPEVRVLITPDAEEPDSGKQQNPEWKADPAAERRAAVQLQHWNAERYDLAIDSVTSGYAVLRLMDYPAWTVRRNGVDVIHRPRRDDGLITIPVPQGRSQIDIHWHTTPDIWIGRAVSLLGLFIFGLVWNHERRSRLTP